VIANKTVARGGNRVKGIFWKEGESFTNSMNLIVSLLVRYPMIATINYDPAQKFLGFMFVIDRPLAPEEYTSKTEKIRDSLETVANLNGRQPILIETNLSEQDGMSFLEVKRDVVTLLPEEISLLMILIEQEFAGALVKEQDETLEEEDQALQEEIIEHMLEDLKDTRPEKKLIGFREEGRVMVFNRARMHK